MRAEGPRGWELDDRSFNRLALFGLAIGLLLLAGAFIAAVVAYNSGRRSTELVRHTYQVANQLALFEAQLERLENGRRGYLLVQEPYRLQIFRENWVEAPRTLEKVAAKVSDNPRQTALIERARQVMREELQQTRATTDLAVAGKIEQARAVFASQPIYSPLRRMRELTARIHHEEERLLARRLARERELLRTVNAVFAITGLLLFVLAPATFWLVRRYTTDLTRARDRLNVLNTDLEGQVRVRTTDLTRANAEIQRFAYIVSHDLRSPLVNVMGFTAELEGANTAVARLMDRVEQHAPELLDQEARHARDDLPEAIGFIRSSTQKMDRLINAILKLSRQGQRMLTPQSLQMRQLLNEIAKSFEHRLGEAGATLIIEERVPDLVSDRLAVEQIFSNLMENAIKYLQPGRRGEIVVRGYGTGARAIYEVVDNGRGIAPGDLDRIFDLFRRAGRQDQPGEGIGLAHVRALVYRLGGHIDVESTLGEGTTFRVSLPTTLEDSGAEN